MPDKFDGYDAFEDAFRSHFQDEGPMVPPEKLWDKIEQDLEPERPSWTLTGSFVLLLTLSLSLLTVQQEVEDLYSSWRYPEWSQAQAYCAQEMHPRDLVTASSDRPTRSYIAPLEKSKAIHDLQQAIESKKDPDNGASKSRSWLASYSAGTEFGGHGTGGPNNWIGGLNAFEGSTKSMPVLAFNHPAKDKTDTSSAARPATNPKQTQKEKPRKWHPSHDAEWQQKGNGEASISLQKVPRQRLSMPSLRSYERPSWYVKAGISVASLTVQPELRDGDYLAQESFTQGRLNDRLFGELGFGLVKPMGQRWDLFGEFSLINYSSTFSYAIKQSACQEATVEDSENPEVIQGRAAHKMLNQKQRHYQIYARLATGVNYYLDEHQRFALKLGMGIQSEVFGEHKHYSEGQLMRAESAAFSQMGDAYQVDMNVGMAFQQRLAQKLQVEVNPGIRLLSATSFDPANGFGYRKAMPQLSLRFSSFQ